MWGSCFQTTIHLLGGEVKAGVQVCLAECWTLGVSVCSCVSAHTRESFCLSWGKLCVFLPLAGCVGIALLVTVGSVCVYLEVCLCVCTHVCLCVFASQPCWCLQKETWQRQYYQVGTVHGRGWGTHKTTCFRKSLGKIHWRD